MKLDLLLRRSLAVSAVACMGAICSAEEIDPAYTEMALYGIDHDDGHMWRFDFATGTTTDIGHVRDSAGNELYGIEASAYIDGFTNIYGFWKDPGDGETKLLYINANTAEAAQVGSYLGTDDVTGAVAIDGGSGWNVYAIQQPPVLEFDVDGTSVVPSDDYAVKFDVLGADIGPGYPLPVTMRVVAASSSTEPFGALASPTAGNVNDGGAYSNVVSGTHPVGSSVNVVAQSWLLKPGEDGDVDSDWSSLMMVDSASASSNVIVLRNGDPVPDIPGFESSASVVDYVESYVNFDTRRMVLGDAQAIYLFELGTTDLTSPSADFQDLVVLVTLAETESELATGSAPAPTSGRLIQVNHINGAVTEVMSLSRLYDNLASENGVVFYANASNGLYQIDTSTGSETLVGSVAVDSLDALEFTGTTTMGFDITEDQLVPIDKTTGAILGTPASLSINNLKTMVFIKESEHPELWDRSFD